METIGRYQLKDKIGEGGMAAVYRAYDPMFKRDVAVKVMKVDKFDPSMKVRFEREAQTIAALEHPAIIPVYDFGEDGEHLYLVMRLMAGESLKERLAAGPIPLLEVLSILQRIAGALDRAHSKGVIHRDLKPGNIMFDEYGDAYLGDFGIARLTESTVTLTGDQIIGTPAYMSPEQIHGDKTVDARSDIYALGVICFELLTGQRPYNDTTAYKVMMRHVMDPIPDIRTVKPDLPPDLDKIIQEALAKEPDKRFATASDLSDTLRGALSRQEFADMVTGEPAGTPGAAPPTAVFEPTVAMHPPGVQQTPQPAAQRTRPKWLLPALAGGVGIILLVILAISVIAFINRDQSDAVAGQDETPVPTAASEETTVAVEPTAVPATAEPEVDQPVDETSVEAAAERYEQFQSSYAAGDLDAALIYIEAALASDPENGWYFHEKAVVLWDMEEFEAALATSEAGLETGNAVAALYSLQARFQRDMGELLAALTLNQRAVSAEPEWPYGYYEMGITLRELDQLDEALEALNQAIELLDNEAFFYAERAYTWRKIGDFDAAIADLQTALAMQVDVWFFDQLAEIYLYDLGDALEAVFWFEQAIEIAPNDVWRYLSLAEAYKMLGETPLALAAQTAAIELDSGNPELYTARSDTYRYDVGNPNLALIDIEKAIALAPDLAYLHNMRGEILQYELDEQLEALDAYETAVALGDDTGWPFNNMALVHRHFIELELAVESHDQAIALAPDNHIFYNERGLTLLWLADDPEGAIANFDMSLALYPEDAESYLYRGQAYLIAFDDQQAALADFTQCLELDAENYWCYWERAWVYRNNGDFAAAVADFELFLETNVLDDCPACVQIARDFITEQRDN